MKKFFILCFVALAQLVSGQNPGIGFMGSRVYLDARASINVPILYNITRSNAYKVSNNTLVSGKSWLNYGYGGNLQFLLQRNKSFGIDVNVENLSAYGPTTSFFSYYAPGSGVTQTANVIVEAEPIDVRTFAIVPKFEIGTGGGSFLPSGLTFGFGFGYFNSKALEKDYVFRLTKYYDDGFELPNNSQLRLVTSNAKMWGIRGLFTTNYRIPLANRVFVNFGCSYHINVPADVVLSAFTNGYSETPNNVIYSNTEVRSDLMMANGLSWLHYHAGLTLGL